MGMVGCWRGGDTWWGISEREAPYEIDNLSRTVEAMRYSSNRSVLVFENVVGENFASKRWS